jgi:protein-arginine kinase activator protein McsA
MYEDFTNSSPTKWIKNEQQLIEFIDQPCTKKELQCFLDVLVNFEEYEYACIVRDKINSLDA